MKNKFSLYIVLFLLNSLCFAQSNYSIKVSNSSCCNPNSGSVVVEGNLEGYSFDWKHDPNLAKPIATDLSVGIYQVTIIDSKGITYEEKINVQDNFGSTLSATIVNAHCEDFNFNDGKIEISSESSNGFLTYSWSHNPNLNSNIANAIFPGIYQITATDELGCRAVKIVEVLGKKAVAAFIPIINGLDVQFDNNSKFVDGFSWFFGDGANSSIDNPNHTYNESGTYEVTLIAANHQCGFDTITQIIQVGMPTHIPNSELEKQVKVFPIPSQDYLEVHITEALVLPCKLQLYNSVGQLIYEEEITHTSYQLNVSPFSKGTYWLTLVGSEGTISKKVIFY